MLRRWLCGWSACCAKTRISSNTQNPHKARYGSKQYDPSSTVSGKVETRKSLEAPGSASFVCTEEKQQVLCLKQGGSQRPASKVILWPPYVCHAICTSALTHTQTHTRARTNPHTWTHKDGKVIEEDTLCYSLTSTCTCHMNMHIHMNLYTQEHTHTDTYQEIS